MRLSDPAVTQVTTDVAVAEETLPLAGARVLELGCGAAGFSRKLAAAHPDARFTALEVDKQAHAKNLASEAPPNVVFGRGGAEEIPFDDASFEVVAMIKSLHHVPLDALERAMGEIRRVLVPGGLAFIAEPVFAGDFNEVVRVYHDEERVRRAAFEATRRAVEAGFFELVEERFFLTAANYRDFAEFERKHIGVTHTEHRLTPEQLAETRRRFERHLGPEGARFLAPQRLDLLRVIPAHAGIQNSAPPHAPG